LFHGAATTVIYTLSLHDALPISGRVRGISARAHRQPCGTADATRRLWHAAGTGLDLARRSASDRQRLLALSGGGAGHRLPALARSEEHTSELQSRENLVCRLLLE